MINFRGPLFACVFILFGFNVCAAESGVAFITNKQIVANVSYCMNISNRVSVSQENFLDCMRFTGYVTAMHDIYSENHFCNTKGTNPVQLIEVVAKWVRLNPYSLDNLKPNIVYQALLTAFPCGKAAAQTTPP